MKKSITIWGFMILIAIGIWIVGFAIPASGETMNFKGYTYVVKVERVLIGDVENHNVGLTVRRTIAVFENGENATVIAVSTSDGTPLSSSFIQYSNFTFSDGSTIITKVQGTTGGGTAVGAYTVARFTGEIIKGTGRFNGIKGTVTAAYKFFPVEKGEDGPKGIGEGTFTYTLPSK